MTTLTEFLESKEVFIAVVIAISICVIGTIYFLIEKKYKSRKIEQDNSMDTKLVRVSDNQVVVEPVIDKIALDSKQNDVVIPVIEKETIKEEVQPVEEKVVETKIPVVEKQEEPKFRENTSSVKKDERPVIPIEEFNEELEVLTPSVSDIYEEVKAKIFDTKVNSTGGVLYSTKANVGYKVLIIEQTVVNSATGLESTVCLIFPKVSLGKSINEAGSTKDADGNDKRAEKADGWQYTFSEFGTASVVKVVLAKDYNMKPLSVFTISGLGYDMRQANMKYIDKNAKIKKTVI